MKPTHRLLRIELLHVARPVWREVIVPCDRSLLDLHQIVQAVMPWDNDHMHEFFVKDGRRFERLVKLRGLHEIRSLEDLEDIEEEEAIGRHLKRTGSAIRYIYDFGDEWDHLIKAVKMPPLDEPASMRCVAGEGAAPLEDCGGPPGDERIGSIVAARKAGKPSPHPDFEEWVTEEYDPEVFDIGAANERLARLVESFADDDAFAEEEAASDEFGEESDIPFGADDEEGESAGFFDDLSKADAAAYRTLFETADEARALAPWRALADEEIIGIIDPDDGQWRFLSVLGGGCEVFGVQVHLPPYGPAFWKHFFNQGRQPVRAETTEDYLRRLQLVDVEFVDPPELEAPDIELYGRLGLPPPPSTGHRWARFRQYHPRLEPWLLAPAKIPELLRGLRLLLRLRDDLRDGHRLMDLRERLPGGLTELPETIPAFHSSTAEDASDLDQWELADRPVPWDTMQPPPAEYVPPKDALFRLGHLPVKDETWEVGSVHMPSPVMTDDGPVRAIVAVIAVVEREGEAHPPLLDTDWRNPVGRAVWDLVCQTAERVGHRPKELWVATDTGEATFAPARAMGVLNVRRKKEWAHIGDLLRGLASIEVP